MSLSIHPWSAKQPRAISAGIEAATRGDLEGKALVISPSVLLSQSASFFRPLTAYDFLFSRNAPLPERDRVAVHHITDNTQITPPPPTPPKNTASHGFCCVAYIIRLILSGFTLCFLSGVVLHSVFNNLAWFTAVTLPVMILFSFAWVTAAGGATAVLRSAARRSRRRCHPLQGGRHRPRVAPHARSDGGCRQRSTVPRGRHPRCGKRLRRRRAGGDGWSAERLDRERVRPKVRPEGGSRESRFQGG